MKAILVGALLALTQAHLPGTVLINDNNAMYGFPEGEAEAYGFYGWPRPFLRQIDRAHYMGPGGLGPDQTHYSGSGGFQANFGAMGGEVAMPQSDIQARGMHDIMYARLDNLLVDPTESAASQTVPGRAVGDVLIIPTGETNDEVEFHFDATFPMYAEAYTKLRFEFYNGTCETPGDQVAITASDSFRSSIGDPVALEFEKMASSARVSGEYQIDASFEQLEGLSLAMRNITDGEAELVSCGALYYPNSQDATRPGLPRDFRFRRSARLWWPWHKYGRHINWWDDDIMDGDGSDDRFRMGDDGDAGVAGEDDNPETGADDDGNDGAEVGEEGYSFRRRRRFGDLPDYVYMPKRDYGFYGFGVSEAAMLLAILVILQNIGLFGGDY